jgi:proteasome-associated ATPase
MPAPNRLPADFNVLLEMLSSPDAEMNAAALERLASVRERAPAAAAQVDAQMVRQLQALRAGLGEAEESQAELRAMLDQMTKPPLHPAVLIALSDTELFGATAIVSLGDSPLVVSIAEDVDPATLEVGDEVLLAGQRNVLVGRSPYRAASGGETAVFDRYFDGRAVVRCRDEEYIVNLSPKLEGVPLRSGDRVRWSRRAQMVFDKVEAPRGDQYFLEEAPTETFADVGGLDDVIEKLVEPIRLRFEHPELVSAYRIRPVRSILLSGPPGVGKTMLVRCLASWLGQVHHGGPARLMHVRPSALASMWYGESERQVREVFRVARERGAESPLPIVLFFDEIDSLAAARGNSHTHVDDRVLNAFMAELDGLEARGNVLVISATNRLDSLDPAGARAGRLGDVIIEVPRPNMTAGREILGRYLAADLPFFGNGNGNGHAHMAAVRDHILDLAVSKLYAPNAGGDLLRLTFRDGRQHTVRACDLVSGAGLANVVRSALECACRRELAGGERGVRPEDVLDAIDAEQEDMARMLTPVNCRRYLSGLPQDVDVVRVEKVRRQDARRHYQVPRRGAAA